MGIPGILDLQRALWNSRPTMREGSDFRVARDVKTCLRGPGYLNSIADLEGIFQVIYHTGSAHGIIVSYHALPHVKVYGWLFAGTRNAHILSIQGRFHRAAATACESVGARGS